MTQDKSWNGNHFIRFDLIKLNETTIQNLDMWPFAIEFRDGSVSLLTVHFGIDPRIKPDDIFSRWRSRVRFLLNQSGAIKNVENDINRCLYDRNLVWWSAPEVKATSARIIFTNWKCSKPEIILKNYFTSAICQKCCAGAKQNNFWRFRETDLPAKPYEKCIKGMIAIHFEHFLD